MTLVLRHAAQIAGVTAPGELRRTGLALRQVGIIPDGALVIESDRIAWLGPTRDLPPVPPGADILDLAGKVVIPGLVDSHTHLVFAGDRVEEWEQRLAGRTYQEIAAAGGGILSTVRAVRSASRAELAALARPRLDRLLSFGVTTVEVKSGYGLSLADELRCLEVIAELNQTGPVELVPTFLGAHAVPVEYQASGVVSAPRGSAYVDLVCDEMLPAVASSGLARFCDVFCERGVFGLEESERILRRAAALGLGLKVHADELSRLGGAEVAARLGATSADHLLQVSDKGIDALAASGTVATLLPGTAFFLGGDFAPARRLIERGATVALATDCNPGTCPTENLPLAGSMACVRMGMLPGEVLTALTLNAACAIAASDRLGSLAAGKQADLVICSVSDYRHLFYHFGVNHVWRVIKRGRVVFPASPGQPDRQGSRPVR
jgi:imidazolonepropionase